MPKVTAVIVAAGNSQRMGFDKLFADIGGKTVIGQTVERLASCSLIHDLVLVTRAECIDRLFQICRSCTKPYRIVSGGDTRQESVFAGIAACGEDTDYIAVHDGARPFVTEEELNAVIHDAFSYGAAILGVPVKDTVKKTAENGTVLSTPDRRLLFAVHTPQVFSVSLYRKATEKVSGTFTDDSSLLEAAGIPVHLTVGKYSNLKITTPEDLPRKESAMRIGHGYDVHRLTEGRRLILGGVEIPFEKGLFGHSDADVLLHAIADALLGAAAKGDIGKMFPDTDPQYKGADSLFLLRQVYKAVHEIGFTVENIDSTVLAQAPKLSPYIDAMRTHIADALQCDISRISVKATTEEKLGFTGSGDGIAAHAVVLLKKEV